MNLIKPVYAAIENPAISNSAGIRTNPAGYINGAVQAFISILFIFGLVYFIFHFILAGYHMISSQGDPKKYEEAQHSLLYSLIGIAVMFSIFAILKILGAIFGITGLNQLKVTLPSL